MTLTTIDQHKREALMFRVNRKLNTTDDPDALTDLFMLRGPPDCIRSDKGPEFIAQNVRHRIAAAGAKTAHVEPGSPWEDGYRENSNAMSSDELLNGALFCGLREPRS